MDIVTLALCKKLAGSSADTSELEAIAAQVRADKETTVAAKEAVVEMLNGLETELDTILGTNIIDEILGE